MLVKWCSKYRHLTVSVCILWKVTLKWFPFLSAPGVWDQVLHSVPDSGHAEGSLRSYEEGKIPDAGDDVRSRTGAPAEGAKEERTAIPPRVALAPPPCLHYTPYTKDALPGNHILPRTGLASGSDPDHSLAICSTSSVGAALVWLCGPSASTHLAPPFPTPDPSPGSIQQVAPVRTESWLHWKNLCNCNVYYADQGLQITTVHFWHPSCTPVCVFVCACVCGS